MAWILIFPEEEVRKLVSYAEGQFENLYTLKKIK